MSMCPECGKGSLDCEGHPTKEQALGKLREVLPHLELAADMARVQGVVKLGIIAEDPDGGGTITCRFEAEEFLKDLRALVGEDEDEDEEE